MAVGIIAVDRKSCGLKRRWQLPSFCEYIKSNSDISNTSLRAADGFHPYTQSVTIFMIIYDHISLSIFYPLLYPYLLSKIIKKATFLLT